jgi:hypothetical protein
VKKERKKRISNTEQGMSNVEGWCAEGAVSFKFKIWREALPSFDIPAGGKKVSCLTVY